MKNTDIESTKHEQTFCTAFHGPRRVASGALTQVALDIREFVDADKEAAVLIFNDATGERVEMDFRGSADDVLRRLTLDTPEQDAPPGPGRPRLGVVAREVTLLPRHWDWLNQQSGGASVALRKLVDEARRTHRDQDLFRQSQDAAYRFLSVMAGDRPGFDEATRALFAGDGTQFDAMAASWPADIRDHARKLAQVAFQGPADASGEG